MPATYKIAIVGNPNSGKTSLFNSLTGMNQRVGNFAGVTVDRKTGALKLKDKETVQILDLPGTYSLYPKAEDEQVTYNVLFNPDDSDHPDLIIAVLDASNLKRNLLFASQIIDLGIPVVLCLTMTDVAQKKGVTIDVDELGRRMGVRVLAINPRKNKGISVLKNTLAEVKHTGQSAVVSFDDADKSEAQKQLINSVKKHLPHINDYTALHIAHNLHLTTWIPQLDKEKLQEEIENLPLQKSKSQAEEIMRRYSKIDGIMRQSVVEESPLKRALFSERVDKTLLHPVWGNLILLFVLFLLFQSIFWLAAYPMDWVEMGFAKLSSFLGQTLPDTAFTDMLINGIIAGIGGVAVFIPQIMILFGCITILEDSGYMARISFLTDRIMRSVGLNGRSVMPLIGGMACAVPAIMSARTIQNKKERLITILVTPLMSCSARLPVYTILIGLVIPNKTFLHFFNLRGLVLMGFYLLGFAMALLVSKVLNWVMKSSGPSFFLMELPLYKWPRWKNVGITMMEKAKIFVTDAGKIILIISILLWGLATYGPSEKMQHVHATFDQKIEQSSDPELKNTLEKEKANALLENSYAGHLGHFIEGAIQPLGYDWKIGIAIITSFAAREVFVGTMATLYSVSDTDDDGLLLRDKMARATLKNGQPVYTLATGLSLLVFYAFAMQCMSTLVIVKRETRTWKYAIIQLAYMTFLAYFSALIVYQLLK